MRLFRRKESAQRPSESAEDAPDSAEEMIESSNAAESDIASAEAATPESPRRQPVRRASSPMRFGPLFMVLALIAVGVTLLLYQQNALPPEVLLWWPLALIAPGALWFLIALVRRSRRGLLGSAALVGAGISLLLGTQTINSVSSTLVGIILISVGTSIVLRGLLMGRQPIGIDQ